MAVYLSWDIAQRWNTVVKWRSLAINAFLRYQVVPKGHCSRELAAARLLTTSMAKSKSESAKLANKMYLFLWNGCRLLPQVRRRDFLQTPLLHLNHRWSQTTSLFRYKRHANLCFRFPDDVSFDALLVFSSFLKQCPTANMNDWLNPNSWNTFFLPIHLERKDTNNVTTALRKSGSKIYFDFVHPVPLYFFFFILWTNVTNSHHSSNAIFFGLTEWKEKRQINWDRKSLRPMQNMNRWETF